MEKDMNLENEQLDNIITLTDENGTDVEFEFLDLIELDGKDYVILLPADEEDEDAGEVVILQVEQDENDPERENYASVENEETLRKVFDVFREKFQEEFNFVEE